MDDAVPGKKRLAEAQVLFVLGDTSDDGQHLQTKQSGMNA